MHVKSLIPEGQWVSDYTNLLPRGCGSKFQLFRRTFENIRYVSTAGYHQWRALRSDYVINPPPRKYFPGCQVAGLFEWMWGRRQSECDRPKQTGRIWQGGCDDDA